MLVRGDEHPSLHVMQGTVSGSRLNGGATEGGVLETEGLALTLVGGRGEGVFTWMVEESDGAEVKDGMGSACLRVIL